MLPHQFPQCIAHKLQEGDHHRNGIAGQAEEMAVADLAVGQRASGFHCQLPEHDFAEFIQQLFDIVRITD
jgi:hypothetical protein